jgi:hypothetical protein
MLTTEEIAVADQLALVATAFGRLPICHPAEMPEFIGHIHALQHIVMSRAAVRAHPEVFKHVEGFE